jgi:hypothetical protein
VEELQAEIAALDERRRVVKSLLDAMRAYESVSGAGHKVNGAVPQTKRRRAPTMNETAAVAADLMEEVQGPVPTTQVVEEMRRRGLEVPAKNTNNVISARLSNNPKFQGRRGHGYWFADRPWPGDDFDALLLEDQPPPLGGEEG